MNLTATQKKAIEYPGSAVLVAAAGSGKTTVLVEKIAWLTEKQKIPPERILVTTFTDKAGEELKARIAGRLRRTQKSLAGMFLGTFHSLGARILRESGVEEFAILEDFLAGLQKIHTTRSTLLSLVEKNDEEGMAMILRFGLHRSIPILVELMTEEASNFPSPNVLTAVQEAYLREKRAKGLFDFHDLESETKKLLENPLQRKKWQGRFEALLVDEFQDTSPLQWEIVQKLHEPSKPLILVGDPRQSIYRFRGATGDLFQKVEGFMKTRGEIFYLNENFRSLPRVVDFINRTSAPLFESYPPMIPLRKGTGEGEIEIIPLPHQERLEEERKEEAKRVAERVRSLQREGIRLSEIALLFRTRRAIPLFLSELEGIPVETRGGDSLLKRPEVLPLIDFLKIVGGATSPLTHLRVWLSPLGEETLEGLYLRESLLFDRPVAGRSIEEHREAFRKNLLRGLKELFEKTLPLWPREEWNLKEFEKLIFRLLTLGIEKIEELVSLLTDLVEEEVYVPINPPPHDGERLRLMTVHAAKGLEFKVVFLCDLGGRGRSGPISFLKLPDGKILLAEKNEENLGLGDPLKKPAAFEEAEKREKEEERQESKRLLYVALTRTRDHLILPMAAGPPATGLNDHSRFTNFAARCKEGVHEKSSKRSGTTWRDWLTQNVTLP